MKDPHCGPLAVVTISLTLLLKYTALDFLIAEQLWQILILAPVLGRTAIVALFLTTPYVRVGGIGETLAATLPNSSAKFLIIAILLIALFFPKGLGIIIASVAIFYIMGCKVFIAAGIESLILLNCESATCRRL